MKEPMLQSCSAWAEKLAAIHPDDLTPSERAWLEAHITKCSTCAIVLTEYRMLDALIRAFPVCNSLPEPPSLELSKGQCCASDYVEKSSRLSLHD